MHWCEHKPSVTVSVKEHEWISVGSWVYENFDICSGISFLPFTEHTYRQAPYQDITEEEYKGVFQYSTNTKGEKIRVDLTTPTTINWDKLEEFEIEDSTNGNRELACSGDSCEVVDIVSS